MAIREGRWRCTNCGRVERGSQLACQGCGATRDENVAFFLEEDAAEVTDAALLRQAEAGAEWLCEYCSTSNPATAGRCAQCGAEREQARSREVKEIPLPLAARPASAPPAADGRSSGCLKWIVALLLVGLAFCVGLGYLALRQTEEPVTVKGLEWSRSIEVLALTTVREEGWLDARPSGAQVVKQWPAVRSTERVQVGTERVKTGVRDKGNGFFEDVYEERPVYQERDVHGTRAAWDVERWVTVRTATAHGAEGERYWPEVRLDSGMREGSRKEECIAVLEGPQQTYRADLGCERWQQLAVGQSFTAVVQGGSTVRELR